MFSPRPGQKILGGLPSAIHRWKSQYFFVDSLETWGFEAAWTESRLNALNGRKVLRVDEADFHKLDDEDPKFIGFMLHEGSLH